MFFLVTELVAIHNLELLWPSKIQQYFTPFFITKKFVDVIGVNALVGADFMREICFKIIKPGNIPGSVLPPLKEKIPSRQLWLALSSGSS